VAHLDVAHLEPDEVEIEAAEVLCGPGANRRVPLEPVGGRVVRDVEVVMADVVAAIAVSREVGIADARRSRRAGQWWLRPRGRGAERAEQQCRADGRSDNA